MGIVLSDSRQMRSPRHGTTDPDHSVDVIPSLWPGTSAWYLHICISLIGFSKGPHSAFDGRDFPAVLGRAVIIVRSHTTSSLLSGHQMKMGFWIQETNLSVALAKPYLREKLIRKKVKNEVQPLANIEIYWSTGNCSQRAFCELRTSPSPTPKGS